MVKKILDRRRWIIATVVGLTILGVLVANSLSANRSADYHLKLIIVVLGENNESLPMPTGPNMDIVFCPDLKATPLDEHKAQLARVAGADPTPIFTGSPELLVTWSERLDLRHKAILFDRAGYGAWEGRLNLSGGKIDRLFTSRGMDYRLKNRSLGDVLEPYCIAGKLVKPGARLRSYQRGTVLALGRKMPHIEVTTANDKTVQLAELTDLDSPTLVVFFKRPQALQLTNLMAVLNHRK